jgi:hypothetical protein
MTMRTAHIIVAGAVIGALAASPARAVTTSHLNIRGTSVDVAVGVILPGETAGCTLDTFISLGAATSVEHAGGPPGTSQGAQGFVQMIDSCTGAFAFGSFDVPVGNGLAVGPNSATLNATIVVSTVQFDPDFNVIGFVDRTLVASGLRFDKVKGESLSSNIHSRQTGPGFLSLSNGNGVESPATISGGLSLDGAPILSNPTASFGGSFTTGTQISMTITR